MANIQLEPTELRALVGEIVTEVLEELARNKIVHAGRLAFSESEAADLLGLNSWQLRDVRVSRKISHTRIVGKRVRYTVADLQRYLLQNHQPGI